ncbi:MAG: T9SS type A sorting domain-containing protein, partial [Bacteroidia bacterium]|nr:T9SS type A sorting domain-containing protein [Bacteroidia bacterium]
YRYQVFTLNGQLLVSNQFTGTTVDIQIPASGLFLLTIIDNDNVYTEKFFVY